MDFFDQQDSARRASRWLLLWYLLAVLFVVASFNLAAALAYAVLAIYGALGRMFALSEAYPDLKANQNMMQLSEELTSTENKIAFARQAYNDTVMEYNTKRESFPDTIFAGMFGFAAATLLEATESAEERKAPKVSFK